MRKLGFWSLFTFLCALLLAAAPSALADHTNPRTPLAAGLGLTWG